MAFGRKLKAKTAEKRKYLAANKRTKAAGRRPSKYGTFVKARKDKTEGTKRAMDAMSKTGMSYDEIARYKR